MKQRKSILLIITVLMIAVASCSKESLHGDDFNHVIRPNKDTSMRVPTPEKRNVMLLYSAGFNSLSGFLSEDINDLMKGWLPGSGRNSNVLLVYSHTTKYRGNYQEPNAPTLTRIYKRLDGTTVLDTLVRYPDHTHSATAEQLHTVLSYVYENFPAKSYGMVFSSHATGYLPSGYYSNPYNYQYMPKSGMLYRGGRKEYQSQPVPYIEPVYNPSHPAVKSIGQDQEGVYMDYVSYEIELDDFADALPMKMDYILFDACLMGGVEVAYELKDKCRLVGFSQTEVLAEGFDYTAIAGHLLGSETPDPQSVCEDFFNQYDKMTGIFHSATISVVDCTKMEPLAEVCRELFDKYGDILEDLDPGDHWEADQSKVIQRYFRSSYHWFYDLKDIIVKAGATEEEIQKVQDALDECIQYKAATPEFMEEFPIITYSGLSMYLPSDGSSELDRYYQTLKWNKATALVK